MGKGIKKVTSRTEKLDIANSKLDRWIDKIASGFRSRSGKPQVFFDLERTSKGLRSADAAMARNISRELDTTIDALFPPLRTVMNKQTAAERITMLKEIQKLLLKGDPKIVPLGKRRVLNAEGRHLMRDANPLHGPNFTEETFLK